jgi:uncharacterized protein
VGLSAVHKRRKKVFIVLFQELYEKSSVYDEMVERHQRELMAKQEEMDQEVEACNRVYQSRLAEMEAAQEAKWIELVMTTYQIELQNSEFHCSFVFFG